MEWRLSTGGAAWLTLAVQLGFVAGTLVSAIGNLPDVFRTRRFIGACAFLAAASNALFAVATRGLPLALVLRFATGFFLAGVYPPAMKVLATWFRRGRGLALGVLIASLTLGKAVPYLVNAVGTGRWRTDVLWISILAAAGGLIVLLFVGDGPYATPVAPFDPRQMGRVFANRGVRLAAFGYFGHMWELYAMWTWAPIMIRESFEKTGAPAALANFAGFLVIGAGAIGCIGAGLVADRVGRTLVTSWAMGVSGACCLVAGFLFGASPALLLAVAIVWGASVVADSAQFSAAVTELSDPLYWNMTLRRGGDPVQRRRADADLVRLLRLVRLPQVRRAALFRLVVTGPLLALARRVRRRQHRADSSRASIRSSGSTTARSCGTSSRARWCSVSCTRSSSR